MFEGTGISGDLTNDFKWLGIYVLGISLVRFGLSGIVNSWLKDLPCLFGLASRGLEPTQRRKLHENMWYTLWHTSSFTWGTWHVLQQKWIYDLFILGDWDVMSGGYPQSAQALGCNTFYIFELGFWLSCCLYLGFETRRKDFIEMFIHHMSTVALILGSYLTNLGRPGILVMMIHDVGDIFLYSAKSAQYRKFGSLADALFAMFAVVFYISRWFIFPRFVILPLIFTLTDDEASNTNLRILVANNRDVVLRYLTGLLCILLALHLMWGFTIARMVKRTLTSSKQVSKEGDPRSDAESEIDNDSRMSPRSRKSDLRKRKN